MSKRKKRDNAAPGPQQVDQTQQQQQPGREANGQFGPGNMIGPGNPYARQAARVKRMMFEVGTDEELRAVIAELFSRARQGDVAAIRLVLAYTAGRPGPAPDPDALDRAELELATSTAAAVVPALAASERFSPDVAVGLLRTRLDVQARLGARAFLQRAARSDEGLPEGQKQWDHPAVRKAAAMPPVWPDEAPEHPAPEHGADEEPWPNPAPASWRPGRGASR